VEEEVVVLVGYKIAGMVVLVEVGQEMVVIIVMTMMV